MKISKSLSLKVNLGNYQVAEFYCSAEFDNVLDQKMSEAAGTTLHEYCKDQITKDVNNSKKYLQDLANKKEPEVTYTDPANDLADGEWNVPPPKRNDKKVN